MPLTGTGKHKYSFQRVPLSSSLPKSFCDCEEHSNNSLTPRETHLQDLESLNVGRNEDEVNVMNSVMNKLFEKNNIPIAEEDNEIEADQDNLIINVASSGNDMDSELDKLSRKRVHRVANIFLFYLTQLLFIYPIPDLALSFIVT